MTRDKVIYGDISSKCVFFKSFGSLGGQGISLGSLGDHLEKMW
jgi:hypothetical protein